MNTINRTFSLPRGIDEKLRFFIRNRELSKFVASAIQEKLADQENNLNEEYYLANADEGQKQAMQDFSCTLFDGLGEHNEW